MTRIENRHNKYDYRKAKKDEVHHWLCMAGKYPILEEHEIIQICKKIKHSEEGSEEHTKFVNKMTIHNLRLGIDFVRKFMNGKTLYTFGSERTVDYLQVAAMGIRRAAELYDVERGYKFSTYAVYWMRSFVGRFHMKTNHSIHIPENAQRQAYSYTKYGYMKIAKGNDLTPEDSKKRYDAIVMAQKPIRIDHYESEKGSSRAHMDTLGFDVPDKDQNIYGSSGFEMEMDSVIKAAELTEAQAYIIRSVYAEDLATVDIAKHLNISRETVRIQKGKALKKLKKVLANR